MEPSQDCQQHYPPHDSTISFPSAITLIDSIFQPPEQDSSVLFEENLLFARSTLSAWGLQLGELSFTPANETTLRCVLQLVQQRQKEVQFRSRIREELSSVQFDRDKYRSYMEQYQRTIEEHAKRIGRLQNENAQIQAKMRQVQMQGKRQRDEEKKMIGMLRAKNQHLLHEIKKKEGEIAKLKEQLKKNVVEKMVPKNSFEVFHNLTPKTPAKDDGNTQKFAFLFQRNERDLASSNKENVILREKLGDIRENLVEFNGWIDRELFGQKQDTLQSNRNSFIINNHMLLSKDCLIADLNRLIQQAKDGILQLREVFRGNQPLKKREEVMILPLGGELSFKKKTSVQGEIKTDRAPKKQLIKPKEKISKIAINKKNTLPNNSENQTPRSSHDISSKEMRTQPNSKHFRQHKSTTIAGIRKSNGIIPAKNSLGGVSATKPQPKQCETVQVPFQDELSDVSSHDSSIVSHVSIQQLGRSRWDILYQEEDTD